MGKSYRQHYQLTLHNVLSDPSFTPPEGLLDLNLKGSFEDLLRSCSAEVCVRFAVNEAKLVLPIFEAEYPDDDRPKRDIESTEDWLKNPLIVLTIDQTPHIYNIYSTNRNARAAYRAAASARDTAYAVQANPISISAANAANAVYYAKEADSNITLSDQLRRLFMLM